MSQDQLDILLKVIVAVCLGGVIGIERELARKPAGIRTHMFVAGAAALVMSLSTVLINQFNQTFGKVQSDPVRVIEAIIVGISFIGAGTVLKSEKDHNVYYLTTAASILFAAGIGITVALENVPARSWTNNLGCFSKCCCWWYRAEISRQKSRSYRRSSP